MAHSACVPPSRSTRSSVRSAASAEQALRFAEALTDSCSRALGEIVAGVVLHGSLTLADYVPGRSDVDLLAVVDDPLADAQLAALTEAMAAQRPQAPGRVDLRAAASSALVRSRIRSNSASAAKTSKTSLPPGAVVSTCSPQAAEPDLAVGLPGNVIWS
jgi:hypothetical protein